MSQQNKARIGVVAADPLRSVGLLAILDGTPGLELIPIDREEIAERDDLAALLLDYRSSLETVTDTIGRIRRLHPALKIIAMGPPLEHEQVQAVIAAGAKGYLSEAASEGEIKMAMDVVLDGSLWAPRKVLARLIETAASGGTLPTTESVAASMTPRERDVLQLLLAGRSNRDIASAMGIDEVTVKAHLGRMLRKTKSTNRVELTLRAIAEQGVDPGVGSQSQPAHRGIAH